MDPLAQELIDAIIDHIPDRDMPSCSLVARRWRQHSQRRHFDFVIFSGEDQMVLWDAKIPKDPNGIPSYVHHAQVRNISTWSEPAVFGRVLKTFSSMENLTMMIANVPPLDQLPGFMPFGEFGKQLTSLTLRSQRCTIATIMSFILSLPNLKELIIWHVKITSEVLPPALLDTSLTRPLRMLLLQRVPKAVSTALTQCRFTCNSLCLDVCDHGIEQLITVSSETMVKLSLQDRSLFVIAAQNFTIGEVDVPLPSFRLPPLSALATLKIQLFSKEVSDRLADLLSSIHSAPVLSSITFIFPTLQAGQAFPTTGCWVGVDRSLARLASERIAAEGGLEVMLEPWPKGNTSWEEYFPKFKEAGGQLRAVFDSARGG